MFVYILEMTKIIPIFLLKLQLGKHKMKQPDDQMAGVLLYHSYVPGFSAKSTVKPVLSSHSKIDKTKLLMVNGSLMKVKSIAECSLWSILQYF